MAKLLLLMAIGAVFWWLWKNAGRKPQMTRDEACLLLGVSAAATEEEVRAAHRRIITRVHPDAGGSDELARKINTARDVLLKAAATRVPDSD